MRAGLLHHVRAVTFDVGGTLVEPWPSVGDVYAKAARAGGIAAPPSTVGAQFAQAWKARQSFNYTRTEWHELVQLSFNGFGEVSAELFAEIYDRFAQPDAWKVFDDVWPALDGLRKQGLSLAIISNWDERLRPLLSRLNLIQHFQITVISTEVGAHKPDAAIFTAAAEQLRLPPASILHVGDSEKEDLHGAKKAGFNAARIRRPPSRPELPEDITTLEELLA